MGNKTLRYLQPAGPLKPAPAVAALIVDEHGRYLMQLRDPKPTIFFPDHWGCFGGAVDRGETYEAALARELDEELGLSLVGRDVCSFTSFTFDFGFAGGEVIDRRFYEVAIRAVDVETLVLGEGREMRLIEGPDLLARNLVPYDRFAVWMHFYRAELAGLAPSNAPVRV